MVFLMAACGSSPGSSSPPPKKQHTHTPPVSSPTTSAAKGQCQYVPSGTAARKVKLPPPAPVTKKPTQVRMVTNKGTIGITLMANTAPCTVNSFLSLAKQKYFDKTPCHRLTTKGIYVLQCGDPTGTGMGGPGYSFADELSGSETYGPGTVAMANAGPNTNGSQFFMVYGPSPLPPSYTVFGRMNSAGLAVVKKIAKAGLGKLNGPGDGAPKHKVEIKSVTRG